MSLDITEIIPWEADYLLAYREGPFDGFAGVALYHDGVAGPVNGQVAKTQFSVAHVFKEQPGYVFRWDGLMWHYEPARRPMAKAKAKPKTRKKAPPKRKKTS